MDYHKVRFVELLQFLGRKASTETCLLQDIISCPTEKLVPEHKCDMENTGFPYLRLVLAEYVAREV
jgi:hypothetical protein